MRIIYFLALATVVLSCTNKQDEMPSFEPPVQNELVITLQNFNDSIISTKPVTRSRWLRFLAVATADISGGFEMGKIGATLGSSFPGYGTVVGGAIGAAEALGIDKDEVLVASTGVIGKQLPIDTIKKGVKDLSGLLLDTREAATLAAESIMTTDTVKKEVAVEVEIGGKTVTIGGMCKGSGMIHPNKCTMLSFLMTDAAISKEMLQKALSADVDDTYNMISVDGDTSTNDTVLLLANGLAENPEITEEGEDYQTFARALHYINETLAKKMAGDGEGATALFETKVIGAQSKEQAKILAKSVICSNLTKAAIFGHDANWGRILCAMGYSGAKFDPEKVDLYFESAAGKLKIIENGVALDYSEEEATKVLSEKAVTAVADIKMGEASASAWGCDLTYDYVKINADYRS